MSDDHFEAYSVGIICASVCTNMSVEMATARLNLEEPTGGHPWFLSEDKKFLQGGPMPGVCERNPAHKHYLFNC